jgi:hypothetical protein
MGYPVVGCVRCRVGRGSLAAVVDRDSAHCLVWVRPVAVAGAAAVRWARQDTGTAGVDFVGYARPHYFADSDWSKVVQADYYIEVDMMVGSHHLDRKSYLAFLYTLFLIYQYNAKDETELRIPLPFAYPAVDVSERMIASLKTSLNKKTLNSYIYK